MRTRFAAGLGCLIALSAEAGPITPPVGPVASTGKSINDVEPRIPIGPTTTPGSADAMHAITLPGSYYLTGNLSVGPGQSGIVIQSHNVTIDLMGFTIQGSEGSLDGVRSDDQWFATTVLNGVVTRMGRDGVTLHNFSNTMNSRVSGIHAHRNGRHGIAADASAVVTHCTAVFNGSNGISTRASSVVSDCAASQNGGSGILVSSFSIISKCTSYANGSHGFELSGGCDISDCSASVNSKHGVMAGDTCVITGNSVSFNSQTGIRAAGACLIRDNTCSTNGRFSDGAGIHVTGSDNRIERNICVFADRGIDVAGTGNLITGNTCSDNTLNWQIIPNNIYGPIIDRSAPASAGVIGNAAASTLGTDDPNANFTY